jgi:magnesium chelatase family protein
VKIAKAYAISLFGLAGTLIEVEVEISSNLPSFVLVGLPDASLSEARDRVRAAIQNSGFKFPARRVTVNLSPASVKKQGSSFDLSIAIAVLAASQEVNLESVRNWVHLGELGLDGSVRRVNGVLPALLAAKASGFEKAVVPEANLAEAQLIDGIEAVGVGSLRQLAAMHNPSIIAEPVLRQIAHSPAPAQSQQQFLVKDVAEVIGQNDAIEALVVAAAGGHHLLMVGPPGAGKTMMAERLPSLLPDLSLDQALETTAVNSVAGDRFIGNAELILRPPFEAPHHSASVTALIGGGLSKPMPGMISLANHGVLFLDEAPEFQQPALESLRQPLESGQVLINRSGGTAKFPANFQLVLAANPCPCGNNFGVGKKCSCTELQKKRYLAKLSGPLLDRVDIRLDILPARPTEFADGLVRTSKSSAEYRAQVLSARQAAARRLSETPWRTNAEVPGTYLRKQLKLPKAAVAKLDDSLLFGRISMRGYDRCLRLAWTIADLAGREQPNSNDVAKAIFLRGEIPNEAKS